MSGRCGEFDRSTEDDHCSQGSIRAEDTSAVPEHTPSRVKIEEFAEIEILDIFQMSLDDGGGGGDGDRE